MSLMHPMRSFATDGLILLSLSTAAAALPPSEYGRPGGRQVDRVSVEIDDPDRNRRIPLKLYVPVGSDRIPIVVFSHDLGRSREAGRVWGEHWASHGYLSIHLQHPGSDDRMPRDTARGGQNREALKVAVSPRVFAERVHDVRFVLDLLEREPRRIHRDAARADLRRVGMSGHAFGARTTLALVGERVPFAAGEFAERRIAAALAFSPSAPQPASAWPRRFGGIQVPVMSITGTLDRSVLLDEGPETRREPFRHMPAGNKYLLVLQGADQTLFDGQGGSRGDSSPAEADRVEHLRAFTLAFWRAHLDSDPVAKQWLAGNDARSALGKAGEFERK